jgi:hypothetical protein
MLARREFLLALLAARELRCDVAVIGGGVGGCAAALAALRNGRRVVMTEETDWVGGQLTSQAVPPDEHPWIEQFGATELYRTYRRNVREYYRQHYPLTAEARARVHLNPGDGSVSRLTHEPKVSLAVLEQFLAPYITGGQLTLLLEHRPVQADSTGDYVHSVVARRRDGRESPSTRRTSSTLLSRVICCRYEDRICHRFESRKQTGELHAPAEAQPNNIQSHRLLRRGLSAGSDHTIDKPASIRFGATTFPR